MKKPTTIIALVAAVAFFATATPAMALHMEFHTYGGFDPVFESFHRLALVFSDPGYLGLFFTVVVMAILMAGLGALLGWVKMGRDFTLRWAAGVLIGVVIYLGVFVPKGSLTIYDPVLNKFETVGNIPVAVVLLAGVTNGVERALVEIIDTAAVPGTRYRESPGGLGFQLLVDATYSNRPDGHLQASITRYIEDCISFELMRPGTTLSLHRLRNETTTG